MSLVVDTPVALNWVLHEPSSAAAEALLRIEPNLLVPDFWLGEAANHSPYDTLYLTFAIAMGAQGVVVSDRAFVRAIRASGNPRLWKMVIPLDE